MATVVALLDVPAQCRSAADGDVVQDAALLLGKSVAVAIEEGVAVLAEDVGDLEAWPVHGRGSPGRVASRSSGLWVASTAAGETWV